MTFRKSRKFEVSIGILLACARKPGAYVSRDEIAHSCESTENFTMNVIASLARYGLVRTRRGRSGGVALAKDPAEIIIWDLLCKMHPRLLEEQDEAIEDAFGNSSNVGLDAALLEASRAYVSVLSTRTIRDMLGNVAASCSGYPGSGSMPEHCAPA